MKPLMRVDCICHFGKLIANCPIHGTSEIATGGGLSLMSASHPPSEELVKLVARAICCGNGPCHTDTIKKREGGKYLLDLPCYSASPDVRESAKNAIRTVWDYEQAFVERQISEGAIITAEIDIHR